MKNFRPTVFKLLATDDKLTAAAGLSTIMEVFDQTTELSDEFKKALPSRSTATSRSQGSYRLGLIQLNSFIYGHDCLDDLEEFRNDPLLEAALKGEVAAPKTIGDFLRDFDDENILKLNHYLSHMARTIRKKLSLSLPEEFKPKKALTIDIDSTSHVQTGEKMEGLAWNYKNEWCLDSQVAFDELGLCHGVQLRSGNTKSGVQAKELIEQCFKNLKFSEEKYLRADSAYCFEEVLQTLINLNVKYAIAAHDATTSWRSHINEITDWKPWIYSDEELNAADKKKKKLPVIELGRFHWQPSWSDSLRIPIVVKRTWKEPEQLGLFALPGEWEYYAVVTSFNLFEYSLQDVFKFYLKRGMSENFIREEKYGYDLKHFPCQKLKANYAYLELAMISHNILRWVAVTQKPDKPHFSKKIRRRFIYIPGKIVHHARQVFLKIPKNFYEEVQRLKLGLQLNPDRSAFASGYA